MTTSRANFVIRFRRRAQSPGDDLDRDLARGIRDGSKESLERFVDRHLGPLVRSLERRRGSENRELAEELARSTLRDSLGQMRPYASGAARLPMRFWLMHRAEFHLRKRTLKGPNRPLRAATANGAQSERGSREWLVAVLDTLPRKQQYIASLALYERLDAAEIAQAMGMRPARAMRLLRRTLLKINTRILAEHAEEGQS